MIFSVRFESSLFTFPPIFAVPWLRVDVQMVTFSYWAPREGHMLRFNGN